MTNRAGRILIAPFALVIGLVSGILVYHQNMNNHSAVVSAEADVFLTLSSSYVREYSKLRSQYNQSQMPVPAEFRAQAAKRFNESLSSDGHFRALMVGMPDRYVATAPTDAEMGSVLNMMEVGSIDSYSELIEFNDEVIIRSMFPSVAAEESCVNCHNAIQDVSVPWKLGDLMGAWVIDRSVERTKNRYVLYATVTGVLVFSIVLAGYVVYQQHQNLRGLADQLGVLAESDPLTKCLNRRGLTSRTDKILKNDVGNIALLALDIDHFKAINDDYGHDVGDLVLVWFVDLVRSELRKTDVFARVGGEEFTVYLVDVSEESAKNISKRICRRVTEKPFVLDDKEIFVSVSIGGVQMSQVQEKSISYYSKIADKFLYLAKQQGRNRVVWSANM